MFSWSEDPIFEILNSVTKTQMAQIISGFRFIKVKPGEMKLE